jgi:hypothetical protein
MKSQAKTVAAYLDTLPDDRRTALKTLRALIKKTVLRVSEGMPRALAGKGHASPDLCWQPALDSEGRASARPF